MENLQKKIEKNYVKYVLTNGHAPYSVFLFMEEMGEEEKKFYEFYNSFTAIDKGIWSGISAEILEKVKSESAYPEYSVREKTLSYLFTMIEALKGYRSYLVYLLKKEGKRRKGITPGFLKSYREKFMPFANELVNEGMDSQEIVSRPLLSDRYVDLFWVQVLWIMRYWMKDDSTNFEQTDAAIEKSVNVLFDILGKTPLDTAFDFAKFVFQKH
jgi:hypothetical protein